MLLGLTACGTPADPDTAQESIQVLAMDTVMILSAYGRESTSAVYDAEEEIYRLEALLSRTREDSEVSKLNGAPADTPVYTYSGCSGKSKTAYRQRAEQILKS